MWKWEQNYRPLEAVRIAVVVNTLLVTGDNPEIAAAGIDEK